MCSEDEQEFGVLEEARVSQLGEDRSIRSGSSLS